MFWAAVPAALFGAAIAFVLLPVVVGVAISRDSDAAPLRVRLDVAGWLGVLGLICQQRSDSGGWKIGARLFGRHLGPWFPVGGGTDQSGSDLPAEAETAADTPETGVKETETTTAKPLWQRVQDTLALAQPLLRPAWQLVLACPSAFTVGQLRARGCIGLPDPAATGQIHGIVYALRAVLPGRVDLEIEADFLTPGTCGELSARVHVSFGKMLYFVIRFAWVAGFRWLLARVSMWRSNRARAGAHGGTA